MQLKPYQQTALTTLAGFLEQAREGGDPAASFARAVDTDAGDRPSGDAKRSSTTRRYRPLKDLPDTPYVCVRIPTGGGKTVVAAHAVKVAGEHYLERDYPLALWLVPSNTIRRQTVEALKNRDHPYRQALDDAFEGRVQVFDITEFPCIRPTDLGGNACIVVGTIQTLRVEKTEGRKVYAHHEDLEPHFARINNPSPGLQRDQDGRPYYSFANLLYLHRPLLIVDEAHNAVTGLTREMQGRINPACIIEFTATPRPGSNVLYSVSARVLKQQQMIKLPIVLSAHSTWQGAVNGALAQRARLTEQAQGESDYVRPIVLFQAQNKDQEVTAQVLKRHLVDNEQLPENRIAVVTGDQRELDDIDLFDRHCPIEAVITVQALKEGWDCSFAYVFCSLAKVRSSTAVEQLLGRVLRMPYARRRRVDALNRAYAHVCEPNFIDAAVQLKDRLVDMGFGLEEAEDSIETPQLGLQCGEGRSASVPEPVRLRLESPLDPRSLPAAQRLHIKLMPDDPDTGEIRVEVGAPLDADTETRLLDLVGPEQRQQARAKLAFQRLQADRLASPAARRAPLELPRLCLKTAQGQLELVEPELFLDPGSWDLNAYPAVLSPQEFKPGEAYRSFEFDLDRDRGIRYTVASEEVSQPQLDGLETQ